MRCGAAHQLVGNHELRCALHDKALPRRLSRWLAVRHPLAQGGFHPGARPAMALAALSGDEREYLVNIGEGRRTA